jgi:poly(3-hydroxyalkanoate) synthetase
MSSLKSTISKCWANLSAKILLVLLGVREDHLWLMKKASVLGLALVWGNTVTNSKLGRKGHIWLTIPHYSPSLKEVWTGTQTGQEAGGRS